MDRSISYAGINRYRAAMPERMKERMLPRADTNGDGAIDKQEAEKTAERFGRGGPGAGGGPGGFRQ